MSEAGNVLVSLIGRIKPTNQLLAGITLADQLEIDAALERDAKYHIESAMLCFTNGVAGLARGFYTWPIVNFYYSVYYSTLSIIASNGFFLHRFGRSPLLVNYKGATLRKLRSAAHDAPIKIVNQNFPNSMLLSQDIDGENPLLWMKAQREIFNYQTPGMMEPDCPDCLLSVKKNGIRRLLNAYIENDTKLAFDKDHAIVSFPVLAIATARNDVKGVRLEKSKFCQKFLADADGKISSAVNYVQAMAE